MKDSKIIKTRSLEEQMALKINATSPSFESLIQSGCVYVDKTMYLYNLLQVPSSYYFLSRPRRFGKSLTVSTLKAIFQGKRELFKDLYIGSTDYDFKEYPVIHPITSHNSKSIILARVRSCQLLSPEFVDNFFCRVA